MAYRIYNLNTYNLVIFFLPIEHSNELHNDKLRLILFVTNYKKRKFKNSWIICAIHSFVHFLKFLIITGFIFVLRQTTFIHHSLGIEYSFFVISNYLSE